ncbi:MAG: metal ABC transporter permease [candidate division Zixibacteria bacterium]
MNSFQLEIQMIAVVVAVACALPGVFLVLRRMVLMSDAISHAILFGIVLAFLVTGDINSPFLVLAAAATGVLTVVLVELIQKTGLVKEDASIGLVFPALFSIGVILISRFAGNVHLDVDAVLLGELAFSPFNRLEFSGYDLGPKSLWVMSGILILNITFIIIFFKELKLATFDAGLATAIGFSPVILNYLLMSFVSITAVGAFDAVGSILVVALMVGPAASAYLLTDRLGVMLVISAVLGIIAAIGGYWLAHFLDASIAGSIAVTTGVIFGLIFSFAPHRGIVAIFRRRMRQKWEFAQTMLVMHISQHQGTPEQSEECRTETLYHHMHWDQNFTERVSRIALRNQLVREESDCLLLTDNGRQLASETLAL